MKNKTLSSKMGHIAGNDFCSCDQFSHNNYLLKVKDLKKALENYQISLIKNASEKRKIIEVDKAILILKEIMGKELTENKSKYGNHTFFSGDRK